MTDLLVAINTQADTVTELSVSFVTVDRMCPPRPGFIGIAIFDYEKLAAVSTVFILGIKPYSDYDI